jgi:hypothetical protein
VVAAQALPKGPSSFRPRDDDNSTTPIPNEPVGDGVVDTCESVDTKNPDSWNDNDVGSWFVIMYVTPGSSFPSARVFMLTKVKQGK